MPFGQCFQAILTQKKLSHAQAAALLGWSAPNVTYYCKAKNPPRPHVLAHIARTLQIDEAELQRAESPTAHQVVIRETTAPYPIEPWPAWGRLLKAAYKRDPARVELAVRTAWQKDADLILAWLRGES
jgi:transcriptional regulator with XRE-family HTH domain